MLTLAATETLRGTASSNTAVTYSVFGAEITGTATAYKLLAQGQFTTSVATIYPVPAATSTMIKTIMMSNGSGAAVQTGLYVNGATGPFRLCTMSIPSGGTAIFNGEGLTVFDGAGVLVAAGAGPLTDATHGNLSGGLLHAAVGAAAGFMSAADKTKLDGVAAGANLYTAEDAQDAVGAILLDSSDIDLTYDDVLGQIYGLLLPSSVTNAKLANMATARFKARVTAGSGAPEDITGTQATALLDLATLNLKGVQKFTGAVATLAAPNTIPLTTETPILTTGATITANAAAVGQTFRITATGITSAAGLMTFRVRVGTANTVAASTQAWISIASIAQAANERQGFTAYVTVRAIGSSGAMQCEGVAYAHTAAAVTAPLNTVVGAVTTVTVNTTADWFIVPTAVCATAGTWVAQQCVVEAL